MKSAILDDLSKIKKIDRQGVLKSIELLAGQVEEAVEAAKNLKIPSSFHSFANIAILGMGGSGLGAHILKTLFKNELKTPLEIVHDYFLPAYVNKETLIIASSYSGATEETIEAALEASRRGAKIMAIGRGGELEELAKKHRWPALIFSTRNNPCDSPRMGLGYSIIGIWILLRRSGALKDFPLAEIKEAIKKSNERFGVLSAGSKNPAKQLALKAENSSVWYAASEHLIGNAHVAANQMNESAKRFAGYFMIPELNHHLLEGMVNPKGNKDNLLFVFLESPLYHARKKRRFEITKKVLNQTKIKYFSFACQEKSRVAQIFEVLVFSSYASFYSAMLAGLDPAPIPFVDYFKAQMIKS